MNAMLLTGIRVVASKHLDLHSPPMRMGLLWGISMRWEEKSLIKAMKDKILTFLQKQRFGSLPYRPRSRLILAMRHGFTRAKIELHFAIGQRWLEVCTHLVVDDSSFTVWCQISIGDNTKSTNENHEHQTLVEDTKDIQLTCLHWTDSFNDNRSDTPFFIPKPLPLILIRPLV